MNDDSSRAHTPRGARPSRLVLVLGYVATALVLVLVVVLLLDNDPVAWAIAAAVLIGMAVGDLVLTRGRHRRGPTPR